MAGFAVLERLAVVAGVSVLTVLAVAAGHVVAALQTDAPAVAARLLKHLHAEPALAGVAVALAGWMQRQEK